MLLISTSGFCRKAGSIVQKHPDAFRMVLVHNQRLHEALELKVNGGGSAPGGGRGSDGDVV